MCFISTSDDGGKFKEIRVAFKYYSGFAVSQKQKSIKSLHENIMKMDSTLKILEISTKSENPLGVALSAFNLKFFDNNSVEYYPIENVFQSSKVFENGGPYRDLLNMHPREAKRDDRLKTSGKLKHFEYNNVIWDLEPKTMFYDWLYISALYKRSELAEKIQRYNAFTDIEFNQEKSLNCQARAAAIFVQISKMGLTSEFINDKDFFKTIYSTNKIEGKKGEFNQVSLFD